jgi:hypothetical protein
MLSVYSEEVPLTLPQSVGDLFVVLRLLRLFSLQELDPEQIIGHSSEERVEVFIILFDFALVIKDEDADIDVIIAPCTTFLDVVDLKTYDGRLFGHICVEVLNGETEVFKVFRNLFPGFIDGLFANHFLRKHPGAIGIVVDAIVCPEVHQGRDILCFEQTEKVFDDPGILLFLA